MPEVRKQTDTKIIVSLTEEEAGKLKSILISNACWDREAWACDLYNALCDQEIMDVPYYHDDFPDEDFRANVHEEGQDD